MYINTRVIVWVFVFLNLVAGTGGVILGNPALLNAGNFGCALFSLIVLKVIPPET